MANSDKDIRVVPNRNKSGLPNIAFTGYNNDPIVLNVLDDNTISFEGSSGQLFSVSNAVTTGTIFSVNDISGIPSFRVDADGTVGIAEFSGNVGIGLQSPQSKLSVGGDINVGAGYTFRVAGTKVLDSSSLGTGVTGSSLTSVGTISSGTWQGTAIGVNYGGTGATNASDSRSFLGAATAGTNSDITRLLGVQHLFVTIPTAAAIGITVKAATSQAASMMEFVNSSNSLLAWITKDGTFSHGAYFTHSDGRVPGFSVQRANAAGIVARGFNSDAFPAIEVQNNPGSLMVGLYPGGLVYGGVLQAWASTASTNTTTGALIVAGGAAIAGTTNFGRDVRIFSSLASSSPFTGSLVVSGGVGISNNLFVGGGVAFTSSIASTSTATGTLVVTGGVGIGGSVFTSTSNASSISGVVLSDGSVTLTGTYTQSNSSTTAFQVRDGSNNPAFVIDTIGDVISLPVAVASTSTGTGSLVVAGGVGIGQSVNIGGKLDVSNTINYVATNSGIANTWTRIAIPSPVSISGLTYGNGLYVGVGYSAATSTDGITWTARSLPHNLTTVRYGNNLYVGVNYGSALGATSTDGITWRSMSLPSSANWDGIAYGNGIYVITATYNNNLVAYSYNGFQWTLGSLPIPGGGFFVTTPVIFGGGYFYTGSYSGVYYFTSVDGINWTLRTGLNYVATNTSCYGDGTWLLTGSSASLAYTKDLTNWTYGSHYGWSGSANLGAYTNGTFAIVDFGSLQCTLIYKNLSTVVLSNLPGPSYATTITAGEGKFIAGAGSTVYVTDVASHTYNIFPHNSGDINNVRIGAKFPSAAQFTVLNATSLVSFGATTPSISTFTGALVVKGGVGIGGSLFVGNTLSVASSTASTSTTTGALIVSGGVGIGGSIYTDSSISVGTLSAPSTSLAGLASTGNLNASTTYYYKISAVDYTGGESLPSNESSVTLTGSQNAVRVTANAQPGVLGYRIYRTTSSGIYTTSYIATTYPSNASANVNQALTYYFYDFGITASAIAPVSTSTFRPVSINRSTYSNFANVNIHRGNLVVNTPNYSTFTNESIEVGNGNQIFVKDHTSFYLGSLTASTGGTLTNGTTYYYKFSAVDFYNNETFTGREFAATAGTGGAITLNFAGADQNVAALRIYRSTTPGNFTNSYLGQFSTSFTDINYPTSNTSPPTVSSARALYLSSRPDLESFIPNIKVTPGGNSGNFIKTLGGSPEPTVTVSGTAGSLIPGTTYYYKAVVLDIFGNSAFQSDAISVGIGTYTSTNVGVSGVDWPYAYARFLVFRSTNRNNFSNSTYYILNPGQTYNDIGDAGYTGTPSSSDSFKIAQIGVANYGFPTNYLRNLVLGTGGNSDQMTVVNGNTGLPTLQAATGGTLVNGQTYYYRVEAQDVFNYAAFASPPVKIVADSGGAVRITYTGTASVNMLNKWSVYRSTSLTNWSNSLLQYHIVGTAFTDYGWPTFGGSPNDSSDRSVSYKLNAGRMTFGDMRTQGFIIRQPSVYNITATPGIGGSLSTNSTYYYRITPLSYGQYNNRGQTSDEIVVSTGSTQNSISLSWNSPYGACAYAVYRTSTRGSYTNVPFYVVSNTSFVDYGQTTLTESLSFDVFYPSSQKEMIHNYYGNNLSHLAIAGESSFLSYSMRAPRGLTATTGTGGTLLNNTTYFYVVEAYDYGNSRTLVSNPVQIDTGSNNSVTLSWNEVLGASYYKVYRNTSLGSFTNSLINVVIKNTSFTDINYPVSNTSPQTNPNYAGSTLFVSSYNNYYSLFAPRTIIQGVPTSQAIYYTDFLLRLAAPPARSIYGSLLELGDYINDGYSGSSDGTYLGIASSTGFSGDYINFQASSVSRFKINNLGNTTIGSTTGSGSTSTGALVISGGVGIGQSLFTSPSYSSSISGAIFSNGSATLSGTFTQNNSSTTAFQVRDGSNNPAFVIDTISDIISLPVAVASTSTGTGSLVVAGGVGIGGTLNVGSVNVLNNINYYPSTGSTGGIAWSTISLPAGVSGITKMIYANNKFVGVGNTFAVYSNDGLNWSSVNFTGFSSSENFNNLAYGNGKYVALAGSAATVALYSTDAITWTRSFLPASRVVFRGLAYGNGYFVGIDQSNIPVRSTDGINWTAASGLAGYSRHIKFINGLFIATLWLATNEDFTYTSTDGVDWTRLNIPLVNSYGITYGNGKYFASSVGTTSPIVSTDLVNWTRVEKQTMSYYDQLGNPSYHNGTFYIPNNFGQIIYSNDLVNWGYVSAPNNELVYGADKLIIANGTSVSVSQSAQGKADISPFLNSSIENIRIGADNPDSATFTHLSALNNVSFTSPLNSTSTTTGALVVKGGVGIGGSINIGGRVGIGTNLLDATLNIRTSTSATPGIVIQGSTSQSASLFSVNSSVGGSFFEITNSGIVNIKTSTAGDFNSVPLQRWYGDNNSIVGVFQKGGFLYTGYGLGYVDVAGSQTLVHQWVPNGSYYITNWSKRMANGTQIMFSSSAGGDVRIYGDTNGSLTFQSYGTYTNNTMVKLMDPSPGTNQALLGIVTPGGGNTRSQLFSYGNLALNMTVAGQAGTDWDATNLFRANVNTKTKYLGNLAVLAVDDTNRFTVGPYGNTTVSLGGTTASTGFIIKAASSQTGNLFEAQSSTGATLTFIDASGNATIGGTLNISGNASIGGTLNVSGSNSYIQNNLYVGNNTQGRLYFSQATLGSAGTTVIPTMAFIGATNSPITLSVLPDNSLSFDGSSGQLFSINNNLSTGWIFSINDISGLPIFRTNADLTVAMGEFGGNVGIGLSNPTFKLQVSGNAGISGTTLISNTTTSTNTTSGALVVSGGVGIGGSLNVTSASTISGVTINSGVITGSLTGTATTATYANQSGYAITSGLATTATYSHQSGYAITSGSANTALYSDQSGYGLTSGLASTATYAHQSGYAITSGSSNTSGYATTSGLATTATYSDQSGYGITAGLATTATYSHQSGYAITSGSTGLATTATNVNIVSASTSASHPVLFTPASGTASGAALSTESTFVYNPSTDILSVSGLAVTSGTASTTPTTGALVVTGGVGIGGSLHVGTRTANNQAGYGNVHAGFAVSEIGDFNVAIRNFYPNIINKSRLILASDSGYAYLGYSSSAHYIAPNRLDITNWSGDIDYRAATGYSHYFKIGSNLESFGSQIKMAITGTQVSIAQTTASTSSTTGGLIVSGGVGIGGSVFTSSSNASSISGVILNNGAITNTGTITSTGVMTLSNSSTTAFQVRDGSNNPAFTIDTIGDIITLPVAIASTTTGTGSLVVAGGVGIGQSVSVGGRLQLFNSTNYTAFVSSASGNTVYTLPATSPATGTSVLQSTSAGVMSWVPLAAGSGTVSTLTAGTGISFSTGATITTTGTIRARRPLVTSFCAGYTPAASGADSVVIRLPDSPSDGTTAITYEPQEFHIRVETASATATTIQLEKYTGTGAFSGTAITSVSISGGSTYEAQTSVFAGAGIFLTSGDKLRINFTALSASHANFSVYLELEEV